MQAAYFGRVDVALPGCESFFMQMHHEEHKHVLKFIDYVKMRGGKVHLCAVSSPDDQDWKCPLHAFKVNSRVKQLSLLQFKTVLHISSEKYEIHLY